MGAAAGGRHFPGRELKVTAGEHLVTVTQATAELNAAGVQLPGQSGPARAEDPGLWVGWGVFTWASVSLGSVCLMTWMERRCGELGPGPTPTR